MLRRFTPLVMVPRRSAKLSRAEDSASARREPLRMAQRCQSTGVPAAPQHAASSGKTSSGHTRPRVPPLSVLSWSVDGGAHTHHRCRRRRDLQERIPGIVETIRAAAPDVVALQDSTPEVAAALTQPNGCSSATASAEDSTSQDWRRELKRSLRGQLTTLNKWRTTAMHRFSANPNDRAATSQEGDAENEEEESLLSDAKHDDVDDVATTAAPSYVAVGAARNGRCGEVQLFLRTDSPWRGNLLPASPGATMELVCDAGSTAAEVSGSRRVRFTLTSVDLSYRGKSLAMGGRLLTSGAVSRDGSPFSLTSGDAGAIAEEEAAAAPRSGRHRAKGTLDAHRALALDFIARVTRPNLIVGNVFMGKAESMPAEGKHAYADAWTMSGAPAHQERTINTFAHHGKDRRTNYFYFVPTHGVRAERGNARPRDGSEEADRSGSAVQGLEPVPKVGAPLPLTASLDAQGHWVVPENAAAQAEASVGVPEVAGRTQRCFVRRYSGQPSALSATATTAAAAARRRMSAPSGSEDVNERKEGMEEDLPISQVFRRCRVMALRPFTQAPLEPQEAEWHARHGKLKISQRAVRQPEEGITEATDVAAGKATQEREEEEQKQVALPTTVPCSFSDQYPLLVFFS